MVDRVITDQCQVRTSKALMIHGSNNETLYNDNDRSSDADD